MPQVDASFLQGRPIGPEQSNQHELLNACLHCVSRYGFAQSTTRMIAETAGVSEGKLFAHFPSKLNLFMAALEAQIEYGFSVNVQALDKWIGEYGSAVASAIMLREYQRANLDEQRAVQIEFLRIAWHREDVYERRNEFVRNTLAKLGVTEGETPTADDEVKTMLRVAMSTGAMVVAGLDRTATDLPYTIVTNRIFA
jgi:AcrR family transcriptional regulator